MVLTHENSIELTYEDFLSYKAQILQSMKIRKMAELQDNLVLKWIKKKLKQLPKKEKCTTTVSQEE